MGKKKKLKKALEKFFDIKLNDIKVYEDSLEVCDCEEIEHQVCDVCQGTESDMKGMLDKKKCPECKEYKAPDLFIDDGVCHECSIEEINEGHYFEVMDRTHVIQCNIDDFLTSHPAMTPKMKKKLDKVQTLLTDVYQWAGGEWDNFDK